MKHIVIVMFMFLPVVTTTAIGMAIPIALALVGAVSDTRYLILLMTGASTMWVLGALLRITLAPPLMKKQPIPSDVAIPG